MDEIDDQVLFANDVCAVQRSPLHGRGVFAKKNVGKSSVLCSIPGIFVEDTKLKDVNREFIWGTKLKRDSLPIHFDSTCFSKSVVNGSGFGQFVNTSHPFHPEKKYKKPNAYYYERDNGLIDVVSLKAINEGDEILVDYHWHLAVLDPRDDPTKIVERFGYKCQCKECRRSRTLRGSYLDEMDTAECISSIEQSSSELQVHFIMNYLEAGSQGDGALNIVESTDDMDECLTQYSISNVFKAVSSHLSHREVSSSFLQYGNGLGFEAFAASYYSNSLSSIFVTEVGEVEKAAKLRIAHEKSADFFKQNRGAPALIMIDHFRDAGSLVAASNASIVFISREISCDDATILALASMRASTCEVIILFHRSILQKVLSHKTWEQTEVIECATVSNVHDTVPCYVVIRRSSSIQIRSADQDVSAMRYWVSQQQFCASTSTFNSDSIEKYSLRRLSISMPRVVIRRGSRKRSGTEETISTETEQLKKRPTPMCDPTTRFIRKYFKLDSQAEFRSNAAYALPECLKKMGFVNIEAIFGVKGNTNPEFRSSKARWLKSNWYSEVNIEILCGIFRMVVKESQSHGTVGILPPSFFLRLGGNQSPVPSSTGLSLRSWARVYPDVKLHDISTLVCIMHEQSHFATLEIDIPGKRMVIHDSLIQGEPQAKWASFIIAAREFLCQSLDIPFDDDEWSISSNSAMIQQTNSNDCGVLAAASSALLLLRVPVHSWKTSMLPPEQLRLLFASMFLDVVDLLNESNIGRASIATSSPCPPTPASDATGSAYGGLGSETGNQSGYDAGGSTTGGGVLSTLSAFTSEDEDEKIEDEIVQQRHSSLSESDSGRPQTKKRKRAGQRDFTQNASADGAACLKAYSTKCCKKECLHKYVTPGNIQECRQENLHRFSKTEITKESAGGRPPTVNLDFKLRRQVLFEKLLSNFEDNGSNNFEFKIQPAAGSAPIPICVNAWAITNGFACSTVAKYCKQIKAGVRSFEKRSVSTKVATKRSLAATWIQIQAKEKVGMGADLMPLISPTVHLPVSSKQQAWEDYASQCTDSKELPSYSFFCKVWKETKELENIKTARSTGTLAKCGTCKQYETKLSKVRESNFMERAKIKLAFKGHLLLQKYERDSYFQKRLLAKIRPDEYLSCIMDSTTQHGYMCPSTGSYVKGHDASDCLPQSLTAVMFHDVATYLFPSTPFVPSKGANWTIHCLATALDNLASAKRYENTGLPRTLFLQLDNCSGENKNKYVFSFLSELVHNGSFDSVIVSFLPVGHTHEDIDQMFSIIARNLHYNGFNISLEEFDSRLVSILKESKKVPDATVIRLRGVGDYKTLLEPHIDPKFKGHKQPHCFAFEVQLEHGIRRCVMRYREFSMSRLWFPKPVLIDGLVSINDVYAGTRTNDEGCPEANDNEAELAQLNQVESSAEAEHEARKRERPMEKRVKKKGRIEHDSDLDDEEEDIDFLLARANTDSPLMIGRGWLAYELEESRRSFLQSPGLSVTLTHPDFSMLQISPPKEIPVSEVNALKNRVLGYVENSIKYSLTVTTDMILSALESWRGFFDNIWVYADKNQLLPTDIAVDWEKLFRRNQLPSSAENDAARDELAMPVTSTTMRELVHRHTSLEFKNGEEPVMHTGMAARTKKRTEIQDLNKIFELPIADKDFLICLRDRDDVKFTGEGFTEDEEALPFYLAKAVQECPAGASEDTEILVSYWRQPDGDPNGLFIEGMMNTPGKKNAVWQGTILRKAVLVISPSFAANKRLSKSLSNETLKAIAELHHPQLLGWTYEEGAGLVQRPLIEGDIEVGQFLLVQFRFAPKAVRTAFGAKPFPMAVIEALSFTATDDIAPKDEIPSELAEVKWYAFNEGDPNQKFSVLKGKDNVSVTSSLVANSLVTRLSRSEVKKKLLSTETKNTIIGGRYQGLRKKWHLSNGKIMNTK